MNAVQVVQSVEAAWHRVLGMLGTISPALLLEELANYKEVLASYKSAPLTIFPFILLDLVNLLRDQTDALRDRIGEQHALRPIERP